jgi:hypothetical protein
MTAVIIRLVYHLFSFLSLNYFAIIIITIIIIAIITTLITIAVRTIISSLISSVYISVFPQRLVPVIQEECVVDGAAKAASSGTYHA